MPQLSFHQMHKICAEIYKVTRTHVPLAVLTALTGKNTEYLKFEFEGDFTMGRKTISGKKHYCILAENFNGYLDDIELEAELIHTDRSFWHQWLHETVGDIHYLTAHRLNGYDLTDFDNACDLIEKESRALSQISSGFIDYLYDLKTFLSRHFTAYGVEFNLATQLTHKIENKIEDQTRLLSEAE